MGLLTLVGLLSLVGAVPRASAARERVVLTGVRGPGARRISGELRRALVLRYRLVRARGTGSAEGRSVAARERNVTAFVSGVVRRVGHRWVLQIFVYSGENGRQIGRSALALRGANLDRGSAEVAVGRIARLVARCRAPAARGLATVLRRPERTRARRPRRRRPPPVRHVADPVEPAVTASYPPPRVAGNALDEEDEDEDPPLQSDNLGFAVSDDAAGPVRDSAPHREASALFRLRAPPPKRRSWDKIFEVSAGVLALSRNMSLDYPQGVAGLKALPNFRSGVVPALRLDGALYPLAHLPGPLSSLGIVGRYQRALNLKYHLPNVDPLRTTLHMVEVGLRYRWNLLSREGSPTLNIGAEFGRLAFVVWNDGQVPESTELASLAYIYLKLAVAGMDLPLYVKRGLVVGVRAHVDYLQIFTAGQISEDNGAGAGPRTQSGLEVGGGAFASYAGFFVRTGGFYRHIFFNFDHMCQGGCDGSASDVYMGASLDAGYAY